MLYKRLIIKVVNIEKSNITLLHETIYRIVDPRVSRAKYNQSTSMCQVVPIDFIVFVFSTIKKADTPSASRISEYNRKITTVNTVQLLLFIFYPAQIAVNLLMS